MKLHRLSPVRVLLAVVLGLLVLGALQAPADAATSRTLSVSARATGVGVGKAVAFSGKLTRSPKGSAVTIQRKVGKKWVSAKSGRTTTAAGAYTIRVTVPSKAGTYSYRAVAAAKGRLKSATSAAVKVAALRPIVITVKAANPAVVNAGGTSTLTGSVKPFVTGTVVTFQKYSAGRWVGVGLTAVVNAKGAFSRVATVKDSTVFRASVPRAGLNAPAFSFPMAVNANPTISSTSLPAGSQDATYTAQLTQVGSNPGTWAVTPALPAGLSLNKNTGRISGTPDAPSSADYQVSFAQPHLTTARKTLHLTVTAPVPPTITTTSLPDGQQDSPYETTLAAAGNPQGTWTAEPLPAGLELDPSTGVISGTPTVAATTPVTIGFTQTSTGLGAPTKTLALVVSPPPPPPAPVISTTSLPDAVNLKAYTATLTAVGSPPGTWSVTGLPSGFKLDAKTGVISSPLTFTTAKAYPLTISFTATGNPTPAVPVHLTLTVKLS